MISSWEVLRQAYRFEGQRYVFGAEIDRKPVDYVGPVDCSELVQHACLRAQVRPTMPDGAYWQWLHTRHLAISIAEARRTHGALMFMGDGTGTGRNAIYHCAFSLGDGRTFEARSASYPVGEFPRREGWSFAARIPGVLHDVPRPPAPPITVNRPPQQELLDMAKIVYDLAGIIAYVDFVYQRWGRAPGQDLQARQFWIDKARDSETPGNVLTELVVTLTANEGERP